MPAKKPPQTAFGKRLVALRQARGLTQIELAKAADTTQRAISYYETEAEFPIASALVPLARALQVTTDELLGVKPAKLDQGKPRTPASLEKIPAHGVTAGTGSARGHSLD